MRGSRGVISWLIALTAVACSSTTSNAGRDASQDTTRDAIAVRDDVLIDAPDARDAVIVDIATDEPAGDSAAADAADDAPVDLPIDASWMDAEADGSPDADDTMTLDVVCSEASLGVPRDASARDGDLDAPADVTACDASDRDVELPAVPHTLPDGAVCPANTIFCWGPDFPDTCGEDRLSNALRCGACFAKCFDSPESTAQCRGGRCERRCREPLADCDCDPTTACDTDIWTDARNCGGCGRACAAGESCAAGRCVAPSLRLKAPISALRLDTARPWFRWALPPCADGARIEVCTTRSCETVEHRWDVTGESFRPPVSLSPGVHFWRATARYGEARDVTPSPWEFAVGPTPVGASSPDALADVNGDGVEDDTRALFHGNVSSEDAPYGDRIGFTYSSAGPITLGDINGDGFGDVGFFEFTFAFTPRASDFASVDLYVYRGGPSGASAAPLHVFAGLAIRWLSSGTRLAPIGDRDGDGYGDLFVSLPQNGTTYSKEISGRTLTAYEDRSLDDLIVPARGDFNADGAEDLVSWQGLSGGFPTSFSVHAGASRRPLPSGVPVSACGAPDASPQPLFRTSGVTNYDDDGYDDLILRSASSPIDFLYRGGPMGLDGSRCVVIAR